MLLLYNLGIFIYSMLISIASFYSTKAKKFAEGRTNWKERLSASFKGNQLKQVAWFHVASLGEFEQARPLIEAFGKKFPQYKIVLTFFSPSGYEVRKNYDKAHVVAYLPLDTAQNAKDFISIVKPTIVFFAKYEFWYHYIDVLHQNHVQTICFSATFRPNQVFFQWYGGIFRDILRKFSIILLQNEDSQRLLTDIGITHTAVCGDTRFDRVIEVCQNRKPLPIIEKFVGQIPVLVVGSSWETDIKMLSDALSSWNAHLKIVIAPHELSQKSYQYIEKCFADWKIAYYSKPQTVQQDTDIMVIDNIGMLSSLYQYATIAYVGGAFGKGLHNILEAAVYGIPIFFGNRNYKKFQEAVKLLQAGGGFAVADSSSFNRHFRRMYYEPDYRESVGRVASDFVRKNAGATQRILDIIHLK